MLVLDGSYSMAYRPTDKTRFERAKELARQIVEESPQGDAFTLVLMSSPPRVVVGTPALERGAIVREIDNLRLPHTAADLPATIAAIRRGGRRRPARESAAGPARGLFPDRPAARHLGAEAVARPPRPSSCSRPTNLARRRRLCLIDLGQPLAENLAVTGLRAADPLLTVGRSVQLEAELKNFGRQARRRQPVELLVDGRRIEQKEVDIGRRRHGVGGFSYRFDAPGDHADRGPRRRRRPGRRQSPFSGGAGAAGDSRVVHRRPSVGPAVPRRGRLPGRGAWRRKAGEPTTPLVQAEVAAESALMDRNLGGYDCVFLCNVAQFTASEARVLGRLSPKRRQPGVLSRRPGAGRPLQPRTGRGRAGQGRAAAASCPPDSARWSIGRSSASIRWAIAIRSCSRFAAAARPAC